MNGGKLRNPIDVLRPVAAVDAAGQPTPSSVYTQVGRAWGEPMNASAVERVVGESVRSEASIGLRFRGRVDIRPGDRLRWGSRILEVDGVTNPDGRGVALVVTCKEKVAP